MDGVVHFLPVHRDLFGGDDTETNLVAPDFDNGHGDIVVDDDTLILFSGQYEHCCLSSS